MANNFERLLNESSKSDKKLTQIAFDIMNGNTPLPKHFDRKAVETQYLEDQIYSNFGTRFNLSIQEAGKIAKIMSRENKIRGHKPKRKK